MKRTLLVLASTALLYLAAGCGSDSSENKTGDNATTQNTAPGTFAAADLDGNMHNSAEWLGKQPTVINFWGTWCPPCRMEIPDLVKLYAEYKSRGVEMVSLAVNDTPDKVKSFIDQAGMEWVMLMGSRDILINMRATQGVPTTIFYDASGKEVQRFVGAQSYGTFKAAFDKIVN